MCGRFTQSYSWSEVHEFLSVIGLPLTLRPRYNIAPRTLIDVVRLDAEGRRELVRMRCGMIPRWWRSAAKDVPPTFNARAETVHKKPMFREAFKHRRCIIPASGFYEWAGPKNTTVPHVFTAANGSPILAFAGLWDCWTDPALSEEILSCTMIVSEVSPWMKLYHDRFPTMLTPDQFDGWLTGQLGPNALKPASEDALREWAVSRRVNTSDAGDDDPTLVEPVAP